MLSNRIRVDGAATDECFEESLFFADLIKSSATFAMDEEEIELQRIVEYLKSDDLRSLRINHFMEFPVLPDLPLPPFGTLVKKVELHTTDLSPNFKESSTLDYDPLTPCSMDHSNDSMYGELYPELFTADELLQLQQQLDHAHCTDFAEHDQLKTCLEVANDHHGQNSTFLKSILPDPVSTLDISFPSHNSSYISMPPSPPPSPMSKPSPVPLTSNPSHSEICSSVTGLPLSDSYFSFSLVNPSYMPVNESPINDSTPAGSGDLSINTGPINETTPPRRGRGRPRKDSSTRLAGLSIGSKVNKVVKRKVVKPKLSPDEKQKCRKRPQGNKSLHLWEFLLTLLEDPDYNTEWIRWENKSQGVFVIAPGKSGDIAQLWGRVKNNATMNYDKMSRSLRFCRDHGSMQHVPKEAGYPKKRCFRFSQMAQDLSKMEKLVALAKTQ